MAAADRHRLRRRQSEQLVVRHAVIKEFTVQPQSRLTIEVGSQVPELTNEAFGAAIASSLPIWVERAMYASPGGVIWSAGTSAGATSLP